MIDGGVLLGGTEAKLLASGRRMTYPDLPALKRWIEASPEIPSGDLDDFRRAGTAVRMVQLAVLLAAFDAGADPAERTALIGWNGAGCAAENRRYWDDYTANGRELGRASLFVPTLPSIPVCEAAIALKIHGPVGYLATGADTGELAELLADRFADDPGLIRIFAVEAFPERVCALSIRRGEKFAAGKTLQDVFFSEDKETHET